MWLTFSQTACGEKAEEWYQITIQCLDTVVVYNKYMEDQLWHYYRIRAKWVKYIFWFLVDVINETAMLSQTFIITNVCILSGYSPVTSSMKSLKFLQLTLTSQLIGNYCTRKKARHPHSTQSISHPPAPLSPLEHDGHSFSQLFCQRCGILFHCGYFSLSWVCVCVWSGSWCQRWCKNIYSWLGHSQILAQHSAICFCLICVLIPRLIQFN